MSVVVAEKANLSAGPVAVVFRSAIVVWKKTYGDLRVAELTGSVLIVEH
jgi:hypothetical protein